MVRTLGAAMDHRGTSFVEIMQNCVIFKKDFYNSTVDKSVLADRTVDLVPGQPMIYGGDSDKGIMVEGWDLVGTGATSADTWDPTMGSASPAFAMSTLDANPDMPTPVGIFCDVEAPIYELGVNAQVAEAIEKKGRGKIEDIVWSGETWEVQ